jgi:hypothetical protein
LPALPEALGRRFEKHVHAGDVHPSIVNDARAQFEDCDPLTIALPVPRAPGLFFVVP